MRKLPLTFPGGIDDPCVQEHWGSCASLLSEISGIDGYGLSEAEFSRSLSTTDETQIFTATRDVLTSFRPLSPRDMGLFATRPALEVSIADFGLHGQLDLPAIERIAGICIGATLQRMRRGRQFTAPDELGRQVEFISAEELPSALDQVCKVWNEPAIGPSAVARGIWIFIATLNAHAFEDGNGRLGRFLLNAYLIKCGLLKGFPIPLGPLIYASGGNVELAVRRAEAFGDFTDVSEVFREMLSFYYHKIAKKMSPCPDETKNTGTVTKQMRRLRANSPLAIAAQFPVFLKDGGQRHPENSSPFIFTPNELRSAFNSDPIRIGYIRSMTEILSDVTHDVVEIPAVMIGGDFIRSISTSMSPNLMDILIFYRVVGETKLALEQLSTAMRRAQSVNISARICPIDSDPLTMIKSISFFSIYFGIEEKSMLLRNGVILLDLCSDVEL
jgi:hypothetical protein